MSGMLSKYKPGMRKDVSVDSFRVTLAVRTERVKIAYAARMAGRVAGVLLFRLNDRRDLAWMVSDREIESLATEYGVLDKLIPAVTEAVRELLA